jgi:Tfp pilus assembly protein PilF
VLRRRRSFEESEGILNKILEKKPDYPGALISLAYIRYKDDRLEEARQLVNRTLKNSAADKENLALSYMMLGAINSRRSAKGGFWAKLTYGTQVKSYFMKARALAPDLPEVHLGLGTFYLCAPAFAGGNLDEACRELEEAVKIAPEFATANARLAQAYKKKGDLEKYNLYLIRAKAQDPENEVVQDEEPGNK